MSSPLTIAIDARPLTRPGTDGFDYTLHLVHSLAYLGARLHLFLDQSADPALLPTGDHVRASLLSAPRRLWKASALAPAARAAGASVLHVQGLLPVNAGLPVVTTIRRLERTWAWRQLLPRQLTQAAGVIVPWRCVADELRCERATLIPYGVESMFAPQCDSVQTAIRTQLHLPERFVVARLGYDRDPARALALWRTARADHGLDAALVIDGPGPLEDDVYAIEQMDARWRPALLAAAQATLLTSTDEAAALALLEALAAGTPAVGSAAPTLQEVAGKLLLTGTDDEQAAGLARLASDEELRTRLMRGGLARAKGFDWVRMGERTLAVLVAAAGG